MADVLVEPITEEGRIATSAPALASKLTAWRFADLSEATRCSAARCILDIVGCAAAGRATEGVGAIVEAGEEWAAGVFRSGEAAVWFSETRSSVLGAGFVNALAASVLDVDDGHRAASGHPGAAVIPAVLAAAEAAGATWPQVLLAVACGYEAGVTLAASARAQVAGSTAATGRWAAPAVAAAVGKLRGFPAARLAHAIALAEVQAPNMAAADHAGFAGSHAKEGIPWAVLTGVAAAEQAALGFQGYLGGLDNPAVYAPRSIPRLCDAAPYIETTYFKPYACCRWIHAAADAVLAWRDGGLEAGSIAQIEVATFGRALSLGNAVSPDDVVAAQFSIPFVLATAAVAGREALLPMRPALLAHAGVLALARRVRLVLDPDLEAGFPQQVAARITVQLGDRTLEQEVLHPLGDPQNPMSDDQLTAKAAQLCGGLGRAGEVRGLAAGLLAGQGDPDPLASLLAFLRRA